MRGVDRERRLLHEHEIVLFSFAFAFFVIGLFIWGFDVDALEYTLGGVSVVDGGSIDVYANKGVDRIVDLVISNTKEDEAVDSAVVLLEVDHVCEVFSEDTELEDNGLDCGYVSYELVEGSVIYPEESIKLRVSFSSNQDVNMKSVFNLITDQGISTITMKFKTVDDLISDGIVNAEELDTGNPFIDVLVDVFGLEETDGSVADKTEIVYVDGQTNLGLTKRPQMLFGSLDVSEFEQETKVVEFENLGPDEISFLGVQGKIPGIILEGDFMTTSDVGERRALDITCSPIEVGELVGEKITVLTSRGNVEIEIYCNGVDGVNEVADLIAPHVEFMEPVEGIASGKTKFKLAAYDDGTIYDVAVLKIYVNSKLVKRFTSPQLEGSSIYEFDYDVSDLKGILDVHAVAVDHAGNQAVSKKIKLWITEKKDEIVSEEVEELLEEEEEDPKFISSMKINFGSGYKDVTEDDIKLGGKVDVKFDYYLADFNDVKFEFKSVNLDKLNLAKISKKNVAKKALEGNIEIINMPDYIIEYFVEDLEAESIMMPMPAPEGYSLGDDLEIIYYKETGNSFKIKSREIVSVNDQGNGLLYVEVEADALIGG